MKVACGDNRASNTQTHSSAHLESYYVSPSHAVSRVRLRRARLCEHRPMQSSSPIQTSPTRGSRRCRIPSQVPLGKLGFILRSTTINWISCKLWVPRMRFLNESTANVCSETAWCFHTLQCIRCWRSNLTKPRNTTFRKLEP